MTLGQARGLPGPVFAKPPNDKSFAARVYDSGDMLPLEFEDGQSVLVAEPVRWEAEFRSFCLAGTVRACSPYLRAGELAKRTDYDASTDELAAATGFAEAVLATPEVVTPKAIVLDVGQIAGQGWAVVEANAAWGSGIYGCDPDAVLDVIRHATIQPSKQGPTGWARLTVTSSSTLEQRCQEPAPRTKVSLEQRCQEP